MGKIFLVAELFQISEFVELWLPAFLHQYRVMDPVLPALRDRLSQISPEGRGALTALAAGSEAWRLYGGDAQAEAASFVNHLTWLGQEVGRATGDEVDWYGSVSYRKNVESLVAPLGVPDLAVMVMVWDQVMWGWSEITAGAGGIGGTYRTLLETYLLENMTDLGPANLASLTPGAIRQRLRKKMAPLTRHVSKGENPFDGIKRRIHLWTLNKVYGQTIPQITAGLVSEEDRVVNGDSPKRWVEQQVREASRLLGVRPAAGRPRKTSVLNQWKILL